MKSVLLLVLGVAASAAAAVSQPQNWGDFDEEWARNPEYESSKALCRSLRDRAPPAADRPTPAQKAALADCSSEALYYGIGMPADPERARLCAFAEADDWTEESPIDPLVGHAMLMTIYANGRGAARDLDVAINLACQVDGAPAESHGRVSHLADLKAQGWTGGDFHYCDDITSGISGGFCSAHGARIAEAAREAELVRITAAWPNDARRTFAALREAHAAYAQAHAIGEVDSTGTMRASFQIGAVELLRDELLDAIRKLEAQEAPYFSASQHRIADAALNAAYREALRADFGDGIGAVRPEGVREAQRAWLRYRDAFIAFAAVRYPDVEGHSIAAWLTRQRTEMLSELPAD
jgi:uncharacterized protein YecT (DUF1311 family)